MSGETRNLGDGRESLSGNFLIVRRGLPTGVPLLSPLGLNVLKGDSFVRIITGSIPNGNETTIAIARTVLPRR